VDLVLIIGNLDAAGSGLLPEKLTSPQPVKKFPTFYGTRRVHYRIHNISPPATNPERRIEKLIRISK